MIHFSVSHVDYCEWREASKLSTFELQKRARGAEKRNEAVWYLDWEQFHRWVDGKLTPWLVPDHLTVTATNPLRSWPILPSQLKG